LTSRHVRIVKEEWANRRHQISRTEGERFGFCYKATPSQGIALTGNQVTALNLKDFDARQWPKTDFMRPLTAISKIMD